jgi:hypothetical protein
MAFAKKIIILRFLVIKLGKLEEHLLDGDMLAQLKLVSVSIVLSHKNKHGRK